MEPTQMTGQAAHRRSLPRAERDRLETVEAVARAEARLKARLTSIVELACTLFDVPAAAVNLVGRDLLSPLATAGPDIDPFDRRDALCSITVALDDELVVSDARSDGRVRDLALVTGEPHIRFYAAQPIRAASQTVGTLCVWSTEPRSMDARERGLLRDLADIVELQVENDLEASDAREMQRRLLPRSVAAMAGYQVAGRCVPSRSIGGDLFDWHSFRRQDAELLQVAVADVVGKGLPAAVTASGLRSVLRGTARFNPLDDMFLQLSESLVDEADAHEDPVFATLFTARLHPGGRFEWCDAGHGLACVIGPSGFRELLSGELPLGLERDIHWTVHEDRLGPEETLLIVSDGVLGTRSSLIEIADDLEKAARAASSAAELVDLVVEIGRASIGEGASDDLTALAVVRDPAQDPGS